MHGFYFSSTSRRYHFHHGQHHCRRAEKEHFTQELKKSKHPTFDGDMTKEEDVEAWLLGLRKISYFTINSRTWELR